MVCRFSISQDFVSPNCDDTIAIMFTIDVHTHILPKHMPKWAERFGYGGFISLEHYDPGCARMVRDDGTRFRDVDANCWDSSIRIQECDAAAIDMQVLSTVPVMFNYWAKPDDTAAISTFLNDHIAETVAAHPDRFIGLGSVPMQEPRLAIKELERCKDLGLVGVQIGTNVNQENLGEPKFSQFFAACEQLEMAVFVHPWDMMGERNMQKYWLPWLVGMPAEVSRAICSLIFSGTLERTPRLRICFAHGGGAFPSTLGRIEHGFQVRPDLCAVDNPHNPKEYLGQIYFDSLVHDSAVLDYLIELAGENRVMLGSDYPFPLGEWEPGNLIRSMNYEDPIKEMLLGGAAIEWLGVSRTDLPRASAAR